MCFGAIFRQHFAQMLRLIVPAAVFMSLAWGEVKPSLLFSDNMVLAASDTRHTSGGGIRLR